MLIDYITRLAKADQAEKEPIILEAYSKNHLDLLETLQIALNPYASFGVTRVAEILEDDGAMGTFAFDDFRTLCVSLQTRMLHGDRARQAIRDAAESCHVATWNHVYRPVLLRTLRVVDSGLLNRVVNRLGATAMAYLVPTLQPQIGHSSSKAVRGKRLVDAKVNGTRAVAVVDKVVHLHMLGGAVMEAPTHEKALQPLADHLPAPIALDGVIDASGLYYVFDLIPLDDFRRGVCQKTQRERRTKLEMLQRLGVFDAHFVRVLPQVEIEFGTEDSALAEFEQQATLQGYSAIVIKKPEAPYRIKRSDAWLTRKICSHNSLIA